MNRRKLARRTALAQELRKRWRVNRATDRLVRGTVSGMLLELLKPSLFAHLGSSKYPGGRVISSCIQNG